MLEGVLGTDALLGIVSQEFTKDIFEIMRASRWQKLLHADTLLSWKVYLHMRRLTTEAIKDLLSRST